MDVHWISNSGPVYIFLRSGVGLFTQDLSLVNFNRLTQARSDRILIDFTMSNARRFYLSSMGVQFRSQ